MIHIFTRIYKTLKGTALRMGAFAVAMAVAFVAQAFSASFHAPSSRLAEGNWVRISISESGIHKITDANLRAWGFADPSKVHVFGYGGARISEVLNEANHVDDLPLTRSEYIAGTGLFFYATGPTTWQAASGQNIYAPTQNPYSLLGYYFLSDVELTPEELAATGGSTGIAEAPATGATTFYDRLYHERELTSPGQAGFLLLGEDFKYDPSQTFKFQLPDIASSGDVRVEVSFVVHSITGSSTLNMSANGTTLETTSADKFERITDGYSYGTENRTRKNFTVSGSTLDLKLQLTTAASLVRAHLNYIAVNYERQLKFNTDKNFPFYLADRSVEAFAGASADTRIWDVTDNSNILSVDFALNGSQASWTNTLTGMRTFQAWEPSGKFPAPLFVEKVKNQNLHALPVPDMVIFTPTEWAAQAERLAQFHRDDAQNPLSVLVLTPQQIYNEFSSGTPDAMAFRKVLKMFYDRSGGDAGQLQFAMFFSRPTFDNRRLSTQAQTINYPTLPTWCTDKGLNDNDSYQSDDIYAFLDDGSGVNMGRDQLRVALGRLPVTSVEGATAAVTKIINYSQKAAKGIWRNNVMIVADDQDNAVHMTDADKMWTAMTKSVGGSEAFYKKLYTDQYDLVGGIYPEARTQFYRWLDEGVMLWTFQGHANESSMTAEGLVTYTDLNNLHLRNIPIVYAATCDFMRWDAVNFSGAEILFANASGGVIAAISATRPVYISHNGYLSESFGKYVFSRDADGNLLPIGEVYRLMKNFYRYTGTIVSDSNKLRYVLLGDPAMRMAMPSNRVILTEIGGTKVEDVDVADAPAELMARQQTSISGYIADGLGQPLTDFNGIVTATLYDAERSITTKGNGSEGVPFTFEQQGDRLFIGTDSIRNGLFTINVNMPAEVANNYRTAAFNLFASGIDGREATGVCRDFYVYGTDHNAAPDEEAPEITAMYLNHPTFRNGDKVNPSPMLMATISDNLAINLSTAGIGHQMMLMLDGGTTFNDVTDFFTPFADGTPGGTICYPLENLTSGYHTLRLRIWDTAPNSAEQTLTFTVEPDLAPTIYDIYIDTNPASVETNFYVSHDRPDRVLSVRIEVFDLLGRPVWSQTQEGRSDMFLSSPVTWNLTDYAGRRVNRGIYIYRATVTDVDSGDINTTASRKIAVAAP